MSQLAPPSRVRRIASTEPGIPLPVPTNIKSGSWGLMIMHSCAPRPLKFDLYQMSAVPEYWIVDPDNRHVRRYGAGICLADGSYRHDGNYDAATEFAAVPGVAVDLDLVW